MQRSSNNFHSLPMSKGNAVDLKPIPNNSGNLYKIRSGPILPDTRHSSKLCPKKIASDKERLYEENINLKQMYNYINDENIKLKTRILQLEKNADQLKQQDPGTSTNSKPTHLLENLKQNIRDLKTEIKEKNKEIDDLKRYVKYTKLQELEGECLQYSNECIRLKMIIDELLLDKGITPRGIEVYEKLKQENEEFRKGIDILRENDKVKDIQIGELSARVRELGESLQKSEEKSKRILDNSSREYEENDKDKEDYDEDSRVEKVQDDGFEIDKKSVNDKESDSQTEKEIVELKEENSKLKQALNKTNNSLLEKNQEIEDLRLLITEKDQIIENSLLEDNYESNSNKSINLHSQALCGKIKAYLIEKSLNPKAWVKSISSEDIISKINLIKAFDNYGLIVTDIEINAFMQEYGENDDQILASVIIETLEIQEKEEVSLDDIFEILKVKSTFYALKNLKLHLESSFKSDEILGYHIEEFFSQGIYDLADPIQIEILCEYFLCNKHFVKKEEFITKFEEKFEGWTSLRKSEIEGIIRRFQGLLFDSSDILLCRLNEKTHNQGFIQMNDFIHELKISEIISSSSEETCAKALIYYYSKSLKKVPYLQIINTLYDETVDEDFIKYFDISTENDDLKRSYKSFWVSETLISTDNALEDSLRLEDSHKSNESLSGIEFNNTP
ncbi:hypothetical protein SteCoe_29957 [Stentor coeruleus]|uniref:Uncharacterized protein n=1 Tax=Stentor coeruleus TaxID=5963 RepID=A0A1R2B4R0_9CILI|nr:hypothetical protein SteCoe_29957 [Stentor coeruleus]